MIMQIVLTLACALVVGMILSRLNVPGGMMIGGVIGACLFGIITQEASVPSQAKTLSQIIAGAFIGAGITREEIRQMRTVIKPALILMPCLLLVNIVTGFVVWALSPMDLLTSLMACIPGGISDIPMIAADMGAVTSQVLLMQFVRLILGIGVFPMLVRILTGAQKQEDRAEEAKAVPEKKAEKTHWPSVLMTFAVAAICGMLGKISPVPAGTMAFATFGSIVFSCLYGRAQMPRIFRKGAQLLSGAYVGASIGLTQLIELGSLWPAALIVVGAYTIAFFGIGTLLTSAGCFDRAEGMLAATPAGASDMALISADLGVKNTKLIVLQVVRLITVVLVFPSILSLVVRLFAGQ